jgi:GTP pyrophosphokinase
MLKLADIMNSIRSYHPNADIDLIKRAYVFASTSHEGQVRKSGEAYITHPLAVAKLITEMKLDTTAVCAALLHDTVEDTAATIPAIEALFTKEIANLVDGVTKLGKLRFQNKHDRQAESFRKMLIAMSQDIRVILVKLADRLHNMRTLSHMKEEKAVGIAQETMDIYAPLANRLGIQWMKIELEDLSFRHLNPEAYQFLRERVNQTKAQREQYIDEVLALLKTSLEELNIKAEISGRPKHFKSIHRKMQDQEIPFEQVYDALAFRILVDDVKSCYEALGAIHTMWKPIPGRFKDYIALPKANRYQSLHTAVLGPRAQRMEVQIRSQEMHLIAEQGIAAHWKYKESGPIKSDDEQKFAWIRQLLEWHRELDDPTDFLDSIKVDLFGEEVYVFTPKGDLKVLPRGSTPIDFAFAIHSEVGHRCSGAKVNGLMVPLSHQLHSGDTCNIITRTEQTPSLDWLKIVKTARARTRIRLHVRQEQRARSQIVGREVLDKALRRYKRSANKEVRSGRLEKIAQEQFSVNSPDDLFVLLGYGKVRAETVLKYIIPDEETNKAKEEQSPPKNEGRISKMIRGFVGGKTGVSVAGLDDVVVRFSKCCNPVPGDAISGFVTRGRGVAIHTRDCAHILNADPDRRIETYWDHKVKHNHPISLSVITVNKPGLLASMSQVFSEHGVNITQANCQANDETKATNTFEVLIESADQLRNVMRAIERIKGVHSVQRMRK